MAAHQAPPSLGFSRQEHWSGLPFPSPMHESEKWKWSHSVMSNSLLSHGLQPTKLLHLWGFPGKSTGVGCHCLLWKTLERTEKRSNQSLLKEISPEYSLEGLMLKLQYFGHLMQRTDSLEKTLMLGKMASPTRWTWIRASSGHWWWTGKPGMLPSMGSQRVRHDRATELNWLLTHVSINVKFGWQRFFK